MELKCATVLFIAICLSPVSGGITDRLGVKDRQRARPLVSADSRLAGASTAFTCLFLNNVGTNIGNVVFSPLSLLHLLHAIYLGSRGNSETELKSALGYGRFSLSGDEPHEALKRITSGLVTDKKTLSTSQNGHQLTVASVVLVQTGFNVLSAYKRKLNDFYGTEVSNVDFERHQDSIFQKINNWVKFYTNNQIEKMLDEPLSTRTKLFLMNAAYFKGSWLYKFDQNLTTNLPFYNEGRDYLKMVPFMRQKMTVPFAYLDELKAMSVELPYENSDISMLFILPVDRYGVAALQRYMTVNTVNSIYARLKDKEIGVEIPKFKIEREFDLTEVLKRMNITTIFDEQQADLSGMTSTASMYVDKAVHKAALEVNEEGSEASAVSIASTQLRTSLRTLFVADHPFIYIIRDNKTKMILFIGRVSQL